MTGSSDEAEGRRMRRTHVLVVNASTEFLDLMRDLLQDESFNVTTTNYTPKTFDGIAALAPDLVVLDLMTDGCPLE